MAGHRPWREIRRGNPNSPESVAFNIYQGLIDAGKPAFTFPNPFPTTLAGARIPSQGVTGYPLDTNNGKIHQFNVTIERQWKDVGVRLSYVGARNRGLEGRLRHHVACITCGYAGHVRPHRRQRRVRGSIAMTTYFDYAATTPVDERVLEAMLPYFSEKFGNANSLYALGREAYRSLEEARESVAKSINAERPDEEHVGGHGVAEEEVHVPFMLCQVSLTLHQLSDGNIQPEHFADIRAVDKVGQVDARANRDFQHFSVRLQRIEDFKAGLVFGGANEREGRFGEHPAGIGSG